MSCHFCHCWQTRRVCFILGLRSCWNSTHRDGMSLLRKSLLSALAASFLFRKQLRPSRPPACFLPGPGEEKAARQRISVLGDEWGYVGFTPPVPHSLPSEIFYLFSSPARTSIPLRLWAIWSHSVEAMMARWMTACLCGFRCGGAVGLVPWPRPLASAQPSTGMGANLFRVLSNAMEELGLEWSPPEEPPRSRLNEWFLPGRRQASRQRASPFFPEVHDEITKSCRAPYSSRLHASSSSALTSVDGTEEKDTTACLPWMSQWLHISARPWPLAGRQKPPTHPNPVGRLQLSLDEPIHRLDKRPLRFTPWRSCKCSRPNSSAPWMSLTRIPQLLTSCAVRPTWPCAQSAKAAPPAVQPAAKPESRCSRSARRHPPKRQGHWTQCLRHLPDRRDRKRKWLSPAAPGPPLKNPLLCLLAPCSVPGADSRVFVKNTVVNIGSFHLAPTQPQTYLKREHKHI